MKASELIKELQKGIAIFGDRPVLVINEACPILHYESTAVKADTYRIERDLCSGCVEVDGMVIE